jgi:hypothetical protein
MVHARMVHFRLLEWRDCFGEEAVGEILATLIWLISLSPLILAAYSLSAHSFRSL